jgi:hypothetical protein
MGADGHGFLNHEWTRINTNGFHSTRLRGFGMLILRNGCDRSMRAWSFKLERAGPGIGPVAGIGHKGKMPLLPTPDQGLQP